MTVPPIFTEAAGRDNITFTVPLASGRQVKVEAVAEPMSLGADTVALLASGDHAIFPLLTPRGMVNWQIARAKPQDVATLCEQWALAAGLGEYGFGRLVYILRHTDLVEADLQRFYNVDLSGWPRGEITTRRVVCLVSGLWHEHASLFWSEVADLDPLTKEATILAQLASAPGAPHPFLVSREIRRQKAEDAAKIARMRARGLSG